MTVRSVSSSISSTSSNTYSNRLSGLESGLDTETLVKGLTADISNKIDSAKQQKQLLSWKIDGYREIITKLSSFDKKYISGTDTSFENNLSKYSAAVTTPEYVSVSPGLNAIKSNIIISDIISLATSSTMESTSPVSQPASIAVDTATVSGLSGKKMNITLDGVTKTITFSTKPYNSVSSVSTELQSLLNTAFGTDRITISESGNQILLSSAGNPITLSGSGNTGNEAGDIISFADGRSNRINLSDKLSQLTIANPPSGTVTFTINGTQFSVSSEATLLDVVNMVNAGNAGVQMMYSSLSDTFTLTSNITGSGNQIIFSDQDGGTFLTSLFGSGKFTDGTNAQIKINTSAGTSEPESLTYTTITKSSNTFELDGNTYTLLGKASGSIAENIKINVSYDLENAVNKIKEFVADYNDILKLVTDKLSETRYKDYPPLTDEKRSALSEKEATLWDEKAKSGMLASDLYLNSIAAGIRTSMMLDVKQLGDSTKSIGVILADIGIKTGLFSDKGKLNIDDNKLRKALSENPQNVIRLLAQKSRYSYSPYATDEIKKIRNGESGLLYRISDIVQNNIRENTGALTKLVGLSNSDLTTVYAKRLKSLDDRITTLNVKLTDQQDYYYNKFTRMETALSEMNKKSAWLSQQFSSSQS